MTFEEQIAQEIRNSVLKTIQKTSLVNLSYDRLKVLPDHVIEDLWETINWVEVIESIRPEIQKRICNTIIGSMETEIKNDVKKLLSVSGVREKLRLEVYPKLMSVISGEE